jgi:hypothetical protein
MGKKKETKRAHEKKYHAINKASRNVSKCFCKRPQLQLVSLSG